MNLDLDRLEELCKKATSEEWTRIDNPDYAEIHTSPLVSNSYPLALVANADDADFIAVARTALPELIQRVRKAEKIIDAAQKRQELINKRRELFRDNQSVHELIPGLAGLIEEIHQSVVYLEQALAEWEGE